jgi:hypothetical protein
MTDPKPVHAEERLETPKQLAARVGITVRQVRHLIQTRQLEYVLIGCRPHVPVGAFSRFVERKKASPCQDETRDRASDGLPSGTASTSPGLNMAAAASAALARRTASKLKLSSRNFSTSATAEAARVIPMKSS